MPRTPWFNQVLLYWDRASTIVPDSMHRFDLDLIDPHMRDLRDAELLEVVSPDAGLYEVGHSAFSKGFLRLLEEYTCLHVTRVAFTIFEELKGRGLARPTGSSTWDWCRVEETTAGLYMSYLAAVIRAATPGVQPVSDSEINLATWAGRGPNATERFAALRYRVIHAAIPAPQGPVSAADLRRFKDANQVSLRRCRLFVDGQLADLAAMPEDEMAEVRLKVLMQPIGDGSRA